MEKTILFHLPDYQAMGEQICRDNHYTLGQIEFDEFPDGERYRRIATPVRGHNVILVGGTHNDTATLDLYDLGCALAKTGARSLNLVIPYFGYSTMERASHDPQKSGEVVTAKTRARLISAIPKAHRGNEVTLLDLHTDGIAHYFEGDLAVEPLYAQELIVEAIKELGGKDCVLGSTDAGRSKWVEALANAIGITPAFVYKKRHSGSETEVTAINANVTGKRVVIYDDMIRTGGSLINAANAYRQSGATAISVVATHGVLPNNAAQKLKTSRAIDQIIVTDSHPNALIAARQHFGFIQLKHTAKLFSQHLQTR